MADESTKKKGLTTPQKVGLGLAAGAAVVGAILWRARSAAAAAIEKEFAPSFDYGRAVHVLLGMPATVPLGASVILEVGPSGSLDGGLGISARSSNGAVLVKDPECMGCFVATGLGEATLEATYTPLVYSQVQSQIIGHRGEPVTASSPIVVRPAPVHPPAAFDETRAVHVTMSEEGVPPTPITLVRGDSLIVHLPKSIQDLWFTAPELSSAMSFTLDATVVAPSSPRTASGYVAVAAGKTTIAGIYPAIAKEPGKNAMGFVEVTVLEKP